MDTTPAATLAAAAEHLRAWPITTYDLALADWLEDTAGFLRGVVETHGAVTEDALHNSRHALATARKVLGARP